MTVPAMWAIDWGRWPWRIVCAAFRHQVTLYDRHWECSRCGFRIILYPTPDKLRGVGGRVEYVWHDEPPRLA